jgi:hypothetical protein
MAVAYGIMVGNVYICQPLLAEIAHDLVVAERTSSLVAVAAQIGYALGILLVVPLADMAEPARLMRWLLALTALGLASAAVAPSVPWLLLACACFAPLTVVRQILMPLSTSLVSPRDRGRIVGSTVFDHPKDVLTHPSLSVSEKRAILASWASDASAIASCPALRAPAGLRAPVTIDEILEALCELDDGPRHPPGGKPSRLRSTSRTMAA